MTARHVRVACMAILAAGLLRPALACAGTATGAAVDTEAPSVDTADVARFYAAFDSARRRPDAESLERAYLRPGSDALRQFTRERIGSMDKLAAAIAAKPAQYEHARACAAVMPGVRRRVAASLRAFGRLLPGIARPPVTVVVGRGNSGGITTAAGVVVGLETLCAADWMQPDLEDRFVHLIVHEYAHVQQPGAQVESPSSSLLYQSLVEGGAELVAALASGEPANAHLRAWARGRECALDREFMADRGGSDIARWLYNGPGDDARRGDLGYWIGYRIARAYYERAGDKPRALRTLMDVEPGTAEDLLRASGWAPACDDARTP